LRAVVQSGEVSKPDWEDVLDEKARACDVTKNKKLAKVIKTKASPIHNDRRTILREKLPFIRHLLTMQWLNEILLATQEL
jgi:hypothetical protein